MMKKIFFTALIAVLSLPALSQAKPIFLKYDHDFGEINEIDGAVTTDYIIRNIGDAPLVLLEVKPSCGCTQPEWTKDTIPPGGEGFVRAIFDPTNLPGPFEKVVYVRTNGIPASTTLLFRGTVKPRPFDVEEKYPLVFGKLRLENNFLMFGESYKGEVDSVTLKIYNQSKKDLYVKNMLNVPSYIAFQMDNEFQRIPAKKEVTIKGLFNTKLADKWGEQNYVFYLNTNDSLYSSDIPIYAQIHIREKFPKYSKKQLKKAPKIQVDAQNLYLGKILKGDSINFQYTITNMGRKKLQIRSVNTTCGCTASVIDKDNLKRGESTVVRGTFYSAGRDGIQDKSIIIISNDPVTPELRLRFNAEVVTNPNALKY